MADVQPLRALHYDLAEVGSLDAVAAPPYDVIDPEQRADLAARSPYNVVGVDLPVAGEAGDMYAEAARLLEQWQADGAVVRDDEPALWTLTQEYTGPDGRALTRRGVFARVRVEDYGPGKIRPHERTHPGPKQDRLDLTRATRTNLSPIFSLYDDPSSAADAIGGEGEHRYVLMCLVALQDPGLTVFPTHRLLRDTTPDVQVASGKRIRELFDIEPNEQSELAPPAGDGPLTMGYIDAHHRQAYPPAPHDPPTPPHP